MPSSTPTPGDDRVVEIGGENVLLTSALSGFDSCGSLLDHLRTEGAERVGPWGFNDGWYGGWWPVDGPIVMTEDRTTADFDAAEGAPDAGGQSGDDGAANLAGGRRLLRHQRPGNRRRRGRRRQDRRRAHLHRGQRRTRHRRRGHPCGDRHREGPPGRPSRTPPRRRRPSARQPGLVRGRHRHRRGRRSRLRRRHRRALLRHEPHDHHPHRGRRQHAPHPRDARRRGRLHQRSGRRRHRPDHRALEPPVQLPVRLPAGRVRRGPGRAEQPRGDPRLRADRLAPRLHRCSTPTARRPAMASSFPANRSTPRPSSPASACCRC